MLDSSDSEESDDENTDEMDREDVEIRLMAADSTTRAGESGPESVGRPPSVPINGY